MPTYTFDCPVHGEFSITVPISAHQDHPPCPVMVSTKKESGGFLQCGETTLQTYTPSRPKDWAIKPIVIHVGKDGNFRFPGHENARVPKGFNRVELKTLSEIAAFERQMNQKLSSEAARHIENEEKHFQRVRDRERSDLRQKMQSFSERGKAFAQFCIDENNRRRRKKSDVGFQVDILNNNSSNREPHRDQETGWKQNRWI
jgi:hypothetical protein